LRPVFVNGKFCAQRTTGVQRYARCVVDALDASLAAADPQERSWTLLLPPEGAAPRLRSLSARRVPWNGPGGLQAWEQLALPRAARGGLLLSLSGSAPAWRHGPQVCVLHDAGPFDHPQAYTTAFRTWYRAQFRRLARDPSTTLVTVSSFARERLAQALSLPHDRIAVVPGGAQHLDGLPADAAILSSHGLDRQPFVLAVGSRNPRKNLTRLFGAWRRLGRDDVRLALVGGADDHVFAREGASAPTPGVVVLGSVDDVVLKTLYQHALGLVFPSLYEGFGLPPLEAMACGCAVAVSTAPALREVCGDAALYFDPLSEAQMAQQLERLIDKPPLRTELRERGRARSAAFTWDAAAAAFVERVAALR
jgi:glycosyltransferase involved in cell wall biosynthesis